MIVCSKTCFLNVLTQLYPKEVLLNAAYYIADMTGPEGIAHLNPDRDNIENPMLYEDTETFKFNEDGQLVKVGSPVKSVDTLQRFHVMYTRGALNPTSLMTHGRCGDEKQPMSPEMRFVRSLQNTDSAIEIYQDLFYHKPRGNGLQILIYMDESLCCAFGWITCEFLSSCFGADIMFIDAKYRKKIAPQSKFKYEGNKVFATEKFIPHIRDEETLNTFKGYLTRDGLSKCTNNVTAALNAKTWPQLIHLHNLLWPYDLLPQGNYSVEQLREIIMYKLMGARRPNAYDKLSNLYAGDAFYQMANEYDD